MFLKMLFDFECEKDIISIAQGTLLLSYHSPNSNETMISFIWLGIAIQFAKTGDAHRYNVNNAISRKQRNIYKRLWWCCILRDRIYPLGARRPIQITPEHFDFTVKPLVIEDLGNEIERSMVYDARTKRTLAELLFTQCELAVALTNVIMTVYPNDVSPDLSLLNEANLEQSMSRVENCKNTLARWYDGATIRFPTPAGLGDSHESVILYTNLMYIYFQYVLICSRAQNFCIAKNPIKFVQSGSLSSRGPLVRITIVIQRRPIRASTI